jgi:hypothetical protein
VIGLWQKIRKIKNKKTNLFKKNYFCERRRRLCNENDHRWKKKIFFSIEIDCGLLFYGHQLRIQTALIKIAPGVIKIFRAVIYTLHE